VNIMDHVLQGFRDRISKNLKFAVSRLSRGTSTSRLPRWAWILPVSIILAIWANQNSREEGKMDWLKKNAPTLQTWQILLKDRSFNLLDDPAWREKAFAEMPDTGRKLGVALISENRYTIAIRTEGDWLYFARGRTPGSTGGQTVARELWENMGTGWEAVSFFERLELPTLPRLPNKRNPGEWIDSRSLSY
jgi:hypothetical protein